MMSFDDDNNIVVWSSMGFGVALLLFGLLAFATYRCKKKEESFVVHFNSE